MITILIASDHAGFRLKEKLKPYLITLGYKVRDMGVLTEERADYPQLAYSLAKQISSARFKKGILICKSGIGNSIVANRLPGVRAALCYNLRAVRLSREHNDSNVLVLGSTFVSSKLAKRMIRVWLETKFLGGRHKRRLNQINKIEKKIRSGDK